MAQLTRRIVLLAALLLAWSIAFAQVTTNPSVTGICPPDTQSPLGVTYKVGDCERLIFAAKLQTTLVPEVSQTAPTTPTFTRATAADQIDFEGLHHQVLSGEARFQGARRVYNTLGNNSENLSAWNKDNGGTGSAPTVTGAFAAGPSGTGSASRVQFNLGAGRTGADFSRVYAAISTGVSRTHSVWLKSNDANTYVINLTHGGSAVTAALSVGPSAWVRYAVPGSTTINSTNLQIVQIGSSSTTNTADILVSGAMGEITLGQTNQNPSEYVSVGVLSAPYHGAGVDGVKYFDTLNGNTVASNIVTEATGAHIDSSQSAAAGGVAAGVVDAKGPYGYLAEGAATNLALQSADFTTTWAISNAADMNAVVADQYVAPDGTTTMDKIQPKNTNATHFITQGGITVAATVYTYSIFARYISQRWIVLILYDGVVARYASFDLQNGVAGAVAGATSKITPTAISGVYRLSITNTANLTAGATGALYVSLNQSDSASTQTWTPAGTELLGLWGAQLETGSIATSYIPTTTLAVARNADVLTYPSVGNISNATGSVYAEASFISSAIPTGSRIIADSTGTPTAMQWISTTVLNNIYDGTNNQNGPTVGAVSANSVFKVAATWQPGAIQAFANGLAGSVKSAYSGTIVGANLAIGAGGGSPWFGTIRNVRIYDRARTTTVMKSMTGSFLDADRFGIEHDRYAANDAEWRKAA